MVYFFLNKQSCSYSLLICITKLCKRFLPLLFEADTADILAKGDEKGW